MVIVMNVDPETPLLGLDGSGVAQPLLWLE
jgi:hypothetical protein